MFIIGWNDGHTLSGSGTGATGIIKETDRNRRIGAKTRSILTNEYKDIKIINCTIDRSADDLGDAVRIANNNNCNLFISNHVNAGGGKGFETFYSRYATSDAIKKGKIIHDRLCATKSCLMNRRYTSDHSYRGYDFYVLKNTKMDALLCEIGFVDNQGCVNAVNDDEVARAYAEGIASAYGLKKLSSTSPSPSPNGAFIVGDVVQVTGNRWATGETIPNWVKNNKYTIKQINGSKLLLDEIMSWIYSNDVKKISGSSSDAGTILSNGSIQRKAKVISSNGINVRSGRGTNYNIIGTLNYNSVIELWYCLDGWASCSHNGKTGYVYTENVKLI